MLFEIRLYLNILLFCINKIKNKTLKTQVNLKVTKYNLI